MTPVDDFWLMKLMPFDFGQRAWFLTIGMSVYIVGLTVAATSGWGAVYLGSPAFLLGAAGVGWVWATIGSRVKDAYTLYVDLGDVYETPVEDYEGFIAGEHRQILSWRNQALISTPIASLFVVAGYVAFFRWPTSMFGERIQSIRPWPFMEDVYVSPNVQAKYGVVTLFALIIGISLGVTLWLMIRESVTIARMGRFVPIPLPEVIRSRLEPLADFHTRFASEWSVGVVLFLVMFWRTPDLASVVLLAGLAIIGLAAFIIPQRLLSRLVRRSYERACVLTLRSYQDAHSSAAIPGAATGELQLLASLRAATAPAKYSVYGFDELLRWMLSQVVAFACVGIQIALTAR